MTETQVFDALNVNREQYSSFNAKKREMDVQVFLGICIFWHCKLVFLSSLSVLFSKLR